MDPLIQRDIAREQDREKLLAYANAIETYPPRTLLNTETNDRLLQEWRSMMREVRALAGDLVEGVK